ncbi:MAG: EF-hand domain-containing protein [Rhizobiaceae bacterium]
MNKTIAILTATAVVAVAAIPAIADSRGWGKHDRGMDRAMRHERGMKMLKRADTNNDGKITLEELNAVNGERFAKADADGDGIVTKAEIIVAIEEMDEFPRMARFAGTMADRLVYRFDLNDDGKLALEEIQNRTGKHFALLDRNDDGEVVKEEFQRVRKAGHKRHGRSGERGRFKRWNSGAEENATE